LIDRLDADPRCCTLAEDFDAAIALPTCACDAVGDKVIGPRQIDDVRRQRQAMEWAKIAPRCVMANAH
jgi:hypothetical protein